MTEIVRLRERHSHPDLTTRKIDEVESLARAYQSLRRETTHRYWGSEHLAVVLRRPMSIVTARRRSGEAASNQLGSHLQANAVLDGLDVVRGSWQQAFTKVRSAAASKFSNAERTGADVVGIDKGISAAITATSSDAESAVEFGTDYAAALRQHSDRAVRRGRSRYWSIAKSTADRAKAERIARHNLGNKRRERATRRAQAHLRNITGRAARELVEAFPDASTFVEEDLSFVVKNQPRPAGVNRRLNGWTKRRLSADIVLHVSASGARRELVSAAYTSQACPRCLWTNRGNRSGQVFRCEHCSYRGRADAVASSNVRSRFSDQTIARYTPFGIVKQALLRQHVAITDGRCPSRGCGSQMPSVGSDGSAAQAAAANLSANGRLSQSRQALGAAALLIGSSPALRPLRPRRNRCDAQQDARCRSAGTRRHRAGRRRRDQRRRRPPPAR